MRLAGLGSLLATAAVMAVSAGAAQAAPTCVGNNQLCGVDFSADAGVPGPYTVATYQDLSGCTGAGQVPYVVTSVTVATPDPNGTPPNAFDNVLAGSNPTCSSTGPNGETGGTAPITGTHAFSAPGTYVVTTTLQYGNGNAQGSCQATAPPNNCTRVVTSTATVSGLSVTKTGPATATAGKNLTYTFTVTNNAATTSYTGVTVTDVLPVGVAFNPEGSPAGCTATPPTNTSGGTVTCPVADSLSPGGSMQVSIVVVPTMSGPISNSATASGTADVMGGTLTTSPPSTTVTTQVAAQCNATIMNTYRSGSIVVPSGTTLCVTNSHVHGAIIVNPGGGLVVTNSQIDGPIGARGATAFQVCGSHVGGSISVTGSTGEVRIGGDANDATPCGPNTIVGSVTLTGNTGGVDLNGNTIGGGVSARNNTPTTEIEANKIHGALACSGNVAAPTNDGAANTTAGAKTGQCTFL